MATCPVGKGVVQYVRSMVRSLDAAVYELVNDVTVLLTLYCRVGGAEREEVEEKEEMHADQDTEIRTYVL